METERTVEYLKIKIRPLHLMTGMTAIFFLYAAFIFIDEIYQTRVITSTKVLDQSKTNISESDYQHMKNLGFSDIVISQMSPSDFHKYKNMNGKIVDEIGVYRRVTKKNEYQMSKKNYNKLLEKSSKSISLRSFSLERAHLKLVHLGKRNFLFITEHHFDYSPHQLPPLQTKIEMRSQYTIIDQSAKQYWWTTSRWESEKIKTGQKIVKVTNNEVRQSEQNIINDSSGNDLFYSEPWKKPSLFEDIIGLHFITVTEFSVPKDHQYADAFIQGQYPFLSKQLQYKID